MEQHSSESSSDDLLTKKRFFAHRDHPIWTVAALSFVAVVTVFSWAVLVHLSAQASDQRLFEQVTAVVFGVAAGLLWAAAILVSPIRAVTFLMKVIYAALLGGMVAGMILTSWWP